VGQNNDPFIKPFQAGIAPRKYTGFHSTPMVKFYARERKIGWKWQPVDRRSVTLPWAGRKLATIRPIEMRPGENTRSHLKLTLMVVCNGFYATDRIVFHK
jgi:hypothetical protein